MMRLFAATWLAALAAVPSFQPDPARLRTIPQRMRQFVERQEVPGVVTLVATRQAVVHLGAVGNIGPDSEDPMPPEAIFWIASMTKPITATAVLMMAEQGKLSIEDPVAKYIPELAGLKTAGGEPARVTLRHMLTHTSGMGEATNEEAAAAKRLADLVPVYARKPVKFAPGSQWQYCQSGINMLGRVVEVVSGQSFPEFLEKRLFGPLGMKDTTFYLSKEQMQRFVTPCKRGGDRLAPTTIRLLQGFAPDSRDRYPAPNGGLFSTAADYGRFARMLLNRGTLDGRKYLSPESVRRMTTIQTGALKTGFTPGNGWGLGVGIVREPQGVTAMLSPGTFGHGGAYGTQAWIDPVKGVALILMVQRADFPNADDTALRKEFQECVLGR